MQDGATEAEAPTGRWRQLVVILSALAAGYLFAAYRGLLESGTAIFVLPVVVVFSVTGAQLARVQLPGMSRWEILFIAFCITLLWLAVVLFILPPLLFILFPRLLRPVLP